METGTGSGTGTEHEHAGWGIFQAAHLSFGHGRPWIYAAGEDGRILTWREYGLGAGILWGDAVRQCWEMLVAAESTGGDRYGAMRRSGGRLSERLAERLADRREDPRGPRESQDPRILPMVRTPDPERAVRFAMGDRPGRQF